MDTVDERESLINDICMYLMPKIGDVSAIKTDMYMLTEKYEITSRCTSIAELQEDRNEFLLKKFLIAKTVSGRTDRTLTYYRERLKFVFQKIGKTVDGITTDDIRYYLAIRQRRDNISTVTANNELRAMSSFFRFCTEEGYLDRNPCIKIEKIKEHTAKKEAFTDMDMEKMRAACRNERETAMVEVLASTGCRVTELILMRRDDLRTDQLIVHGKGGRDRIVYLNAKAIMALQRYLGARKDKNPYVFPMAAISVSRRQKGEAAKCMAEWYKFPDLVATDGHCVAGSIERIIRKIADRAGVEGAHPHRFRRTCATFALRRGMPIEQVSKMLGHEKITTTQIYLDLSEEDLRLAHKKYVV